MRRAAILRHSGNMIADPTIESKARESVPKLQLGDRVQLTEPRFTRLQEACFTEMRRPFT